MQVRRCTNAKCLRPYRIRKNENPPSELRSGKLTCPHCDHVEALWEDEAFLLQPLTAQQEAAFSKRGLNNFLFMQHIQPKHWPLAIRAMLLAKPFSQARFLQPRKNH